MQQTTLVNANVQVQELPGGGRAIVVTDQILIPVSETESMAIPTQVFMIPVDKDTANGLSKDLHSSDLVVAPASALPKVQ